MDISDTTVVDLGLSYQQTNLVCEYDLEQHLHNLEEDLHDLEEDLHDNLDH